MQKNGKCFRFKNCSVKGKRGENMKSVKGKRGEDMKSVKGHMNVKLKIYNGVKYNPQNKIISEIVCNIKGYKVLTGKKATKFGKQIEENSRDKYNEYLLITLDNGEKAIFCNSLVDMFII